MCARFISLSISALQLRFNGFRAGGQHSGDSAPAINDLSGDSHRGSHHISIHYEEMLLSTGCFYELFGDLKRLEIAANAGSEVTLVRARREEMGNPKVKNGIESIAIRGGHKFCFSVSSLILHNWAFQKVRITFVISLAEPQHNAEASHRRRRITLLPGNSVRSKLFRWVLVPAPPDHKTRISSS